jgi:hypothetical protein
MIPRSSSLEEAYKLDWWPSKLGGKTSYFFAWSLTLVAGLAAHHLDAFHLRRRWQSRDPANDVDWERKSELSISLGCERVQLTI